MKYNTYKEDSKIQTTIIIPKEIWQQINDYCKENGIKKNFLIVKILTEFIKSENEKIKVPF